MNLIRNTSQLSFSLIRGGSTMPVTYKAKEKLDECKED